MDAQTSTNNPSNISLDYLSSPEFKDMVRQELSDIPADFIASQEKRASQVSLVERIVRVEEAQRSHEQLSRALLEQTNLRFEEMQRNMDKRFDVSDNRFQEMQINMDKRFQEVLISIDKRFEAMDKRFEEMQTSMSMRFEAMDKRFEEMQTNMSTRFEAMDKRFQEMQRNMGKRFDAMDKRFEEMQTNMNMRFEATDKRFEALGRRLDRFMFWTLGLTVSATFLIINFLR